MIRFNLQFVEETTNDKLEALGFGHVSVEVNSRRCCSKDVGSSMMLLISLVEMVDGLSSLSSGSRRSFDFVAVGGNFPLHFHLDQERLEISCGDKLLGDVPLEEAIVRFSQALAEILSGKHLVGPSSEAVAEDLKASVIRLSEACPAAAEHLEFFLDH